MTVLTDTAEDAHEVVYDMIYRGKKIAASIKIPASPVRTKDVKATYQSYIVEVLDARP